MTVFLLVPETLTLCNTVLERLWNPLCVDSLWIPGFISWVLIIYSGVILRCVAGDTARSWERCLLLYTFIYLCHLSEHKSLKDPAQVCSHQCWPCPTPWCGQVQDKHRKATVTGNGRLPTTLLKPPSLRNYNKEGRYWADHWRSLPEVWLVGASASVTRRMIMMTTEHLEVLIIAPGAPCITSKPSATPWARSVTHLCEGENSETGWWPQGHPRPPKAEEATWDSNPDRAECKAVLSLALPLLAH